MDAIIFLRPREVADRLGVSRSCYYAFRADGLLPPPIAVGKRTQAHPEGEISAVQRALVRGADDTQLRALCRELVAARAAA
jgi:predicted DNA-binding transcriptional regulator AlpA